MAASVASRFLLLLNPIKGAVTEEVRFIGYLSIQETIIRKGTICKKIPLKKSFEFGMALK